MMLRFDLRRERQGWSVIDRFTGWPAVISGLHQRGLALHEADETADLLELLAHAGRPLEITPPPPDRW